MDLAACSLRQEGSNSAEQYVEGLPGWRPMGFTGDVPFRPHRLPGQVVWSINLLGVEANSDYFFFFLDGSQEQDVCFLHADFTHPSSVSPYACEKSESSYWHWGAAVVCVSISCIPS